MSAFLVKWFLISNCIKSSGSLCQFVMVSIFRSFFFVISYFHRFSFFLLLTEWHSVRWWITYYPSWLYDVKLCSSAVQNPKPLLAMNTLAPTAIILKCRSCSFGLPICLHKSFHTTGWLLYEWPKVAFYIWRASYFNNAAFYDRLLSIKWLKAWPAWVREAA